MGPHTIDHVGPVCTSADPMTAPTTAELARTTVYADVLAGYVTVISRLSASRDRSLAADQG